VTEAEFTTQVIATARMFGWTTAHFRPALTKHGWRTAVQGDGKGFPDLVLLHVERGELWFRELKVGKGRPTDEQRAWGEQLAAAGQDFAVWRDTDWDAIVVELSAGRARVGA
jgi:VRR-NUC domain